MSDDGAQVIPILGSSGATSDRVEAAEDDRAQETLGLRHALDENGRAKVSRCWHSEHAARVDQAARRCYCGGCGCELDPYDVLEDVARRNAIIVDTRRRLTRQIGHLGERLEELQRQERNAKARIRNAKKRVGLERNAGGWPLCPECGSADLEDRLNVVPDLRGDLWCPSCRRITVRRGRAA